MKNLWWIFIKKNKYAQDIEVLGTYINNCTKILCKCKKDGYEWSTKPNILLNGHGCPICGGTAKLTHEEFINRVQQINPNIQVLEPYKNRKTKIKCKCKICGHEWSIRPHNLLDGQGCPKCGKKRAAQKLTKTQEEFVTRLQQVNTNIELLEDYKGYHTKILCKCKIDGHEWEARPGDLLKGHGCPKCGGTGKLTHEEFISRLQQVNPDIEVLESYINSVTKIKCKCKIDGYIWTSKPPDLLQGHGCPKCSISQGEKRITQYLDNLCLNYIYNMCYFKDLVGVGGGLLRPDFIIPSLKIWIEFDGIQHFEPVNFRGAMNEQQLQERFNYTQQNDKIKNQYAKDNNWTLIRIPHTEYDNIEQILAAYLKQEQVI